MQSKAFERSVKTTPTKYSKTLFPILNEKGMIGAVIFSIDCDEF